MMLMIMMMITKMFSDIRVRLKGTESFLSEHRHFSFTPRVSKRQKLLNVVVFLFLCFLYVGQRLALSQLTMVGYSNTLAPCPPTHPHFHAGHCRSDNPLVTWVESHDVSAVTPWWRKQVVSLPLAARAHTPWKHSLVSATTDILVYTTVCTTSIFYPDLCSASIKLYAYIHLTIITDMLIIMYILFSK